MSKLALFRFRNAIRSNLAVRTSHGFCTQSKQPLDSAVDSFVKSQPGSSYCRLTGITKNTLRSDITNVLEECRLTLDDVKVEYNRNYMPYSAMVRFPSPQAYGLANKLIARKGRLYKLEKMEQDQWDTLAPYEGKAVLLQGIPQLASIPDMERFLSGCNYFDNSIQFFFRAGARGKLAMVRFPSQIEAMNCFITKNKSFLLNNQILVRVLQ